MDGARPRNRRRRHRKGADQNAPHTTTEQTESISTSDPVTESQSDERTDSSNGTNSESTETDLMQKRWETQPTPPMESCSPSDKLSMEPAMSINPSVQSVDINGQPSPGVDRTSATFQPSLSSEPTPTERRVKKLRKRCRKSDTKRDTHVSPSSTDEVSTSASENEPCDVTDDRAFISMNLPLSSELYTPAYCVQATDADCDLEKRTEQSVSTTCATNVSSNHDRTVSTEIESKSAISDFMNDFVRTSSKHDLSTVPSEVQVESNVHLAHDELVQTVHPDSLPSNSAEPPETESNAKPVEIDIKAGKSSRESSPARESSVKLVTIQTDANMIESPGKKRWKPKFSWPKGQLELGTGDYTTDSNIPNADQPSKQEGQIELTKVTPVSEEIPNKTKRKQPKKKASFSCTGRKRSSDSQNNPVDAVNTQLKDLENEKQTSASAKQTKLKMNIGKSKLNKRTDHNEVNTKNGIVDKNQCAQEVETEIVTPYAEIKAPRLRINKPDFEKIFDDEDIKLILEDVHVQHDMMFDNNDEDGSHQRESKLIEPEVTMKNDPHRREKRNMKEIANDAFEEYNMITNAIELQIQQNNEQLQKANLLNKTSKQNGTKLGFRISKTRKKADKVETIEISGSPQIPTADASVPSKKFGFGFGFGGKGKGEKKVKKPKLGVDANVDLTAPKLDADLDVTGVPGSLDVDVNMPKMQVDVGAPSVDLTGPAIGIPEVGVDVGLGGAGQIDSDVKLAAPDVSVKSPKFGFSFGKKAKKPKVAVGASVDAPKLDVSVPAVDAGLSGDVQLPSAEVSVPSKKFGFGFGFGGKGKGEKKVKKPKLGVDANLDLAADVAVPTPELDVDVNAKADSKGHGFKLPWSGKVSLPKAHIDTGAVTADANVGLPSASIDVSVPTVELPSVKAGVDIDGGELHVPDLSIGGGLGVELDVNDVSPVIGVMKLEPEICVSSLNVPTFRAPSAVSSDLFSADDVDLLLADVELPTVSYGLADDHLSSVDDSVCVSSAVSRPVTSATTKFSAVDVFGNIDAFSSLYGLGDVCDTSAPISNEMSSEFLLVNDSSVGLLQPDVSPSVLMSSSKFEAGSLELNGIDLDHNTEFTVRSEQSASKSPSRFSTLRLPHWGHRKVESSEQVQPQLNISSTVDSRDQLSSTIGHSKPVSDTLSLDHHEASSPDTVKRDKATHHHFTLSLPRLFGSLRKKKSRRVYPDYSQPDVCITDGVQQEVFSTDDQASPKKPKSETKKKAKPKKRKKVKPDDLLITGVNEPLELSARPRTPSLKSKDLTIRQTWHGDDELRRVSHNQLVMTDDQEAPALPPSPHGIRISPVLMDPSNLQDVRRRSPTDSSKRRPWSTLETPPPGCLFVNDDYLFPDALTPTKIPSFRGSKDVVYNVPYMDDRALPAEEPEWAIGESRRTLLSQLSQRSDSLIRMTAEEESSIISLDDKENRYDSSEGKSSRIGRLLARRKARSKSKEKSYDKPARSTSRSKGTSRFAVKMK